MTKPAMRSEVVGVSDLRRKIEKLGGDSLAAVEEGLTIGATVVATSAQRNIRAKGLVLTHRMVDSIRAWPAEYSVGGQGGGKTQVSIPIGPSKEIFWAKFSELGTPNESARPWLRPAFDENLDAVRLAVATSLKKHYDRLARKKGRVE